MSAVDPVITFLVALLRTTMVRRMGKNSLVHARVALRVNAANAF